MLLALALAACASTDPSGPPPPIASTDSSAFPTSQSEIVAMAGTCDVDVTGASELEVGRSLAITYGPDGLGDLSAEVFASSADLDAWAAAAGATVDASSVDFATESVLVAGYTAVDSCSAPIFSVDAWDLGAGVHVDFGAEDPSTNCETGCAEVDYYGFAWVIPATGGATACALATGYCG